jgi:hypothetical protein
MVNVSWKSLLNNFHHRFGNGDPNCNIKVEPKYASFQFPNDVISVGYNGERIVYSGNGGRKILDFEGDQWECFEKDGSRWEPTKLDHEGREILRQYCVSMMDLIKRLKR